jgi:5-methylcytosine-specific restriction enzyme subunit McrC
MSLDRTLLERVDRERNRLTARYAGVHRLVRLMSERSGLDDEHAVGRDVLPGFLWNMATLFERFVARFLSDHLPDHDVLTQEKLHQLYAVVRSGPTLKAPRPRPDLVIRRKRDGRTVGVFDTKYRDLWATKLPREILYQMSVYALAWSERGGEDVPAVVLYPVVGGDRPDMELSLRVRGAASRRIILRAVDWASAAAALPGDSIALAQRWVGMRI